MVPVDERCLGAEPVPQAESYFGLPLWCEWSPRASQSFWFLCQVVRCGWQVLLLDPAVCEHCTSVLLTVLPKTITLMRLHQLSSSAQNILMFQIHWVPIVTLERDTHYGKPKISCSLPLKAFTPLRI